MKRRSFLKGAALTALATALPAGVSCSSRKKSVRETGLPPVAGEFSFHADGTFKVLQLTDTHYIAGDPRSERALRCVEEMLEKEKPDLVIHTGDVIFGAPSRESVLEILAPISRRGIPFAVAMGNHDGQFDVPRAELYEIIRSVPGCINRPAAEKGIAGDSNDVIVLSSPKGPERILYLFDSGDAVVLKGEETLHSYDYIRYDQLGWYRTQSLHWREVAGGSPVPSMAFFHIPLRELEDALREGGELLSGNNCEPPCPSRLNSGLLAQMREMQDIDALVFGHDHDCDYVLRYGGLYYIYGRYSGCDTVYNHLGRDGTGGEKVSGARIFEFLQGRPGFRTWVRLQGGEIQQMTDYFVN